MLLRGYQLWSGKISFWPWPLYFDEPWAVAALEISRYGLSSDIVNLFPRKIFRYLGNGLGPTATAFLRTLSDLLVLTGGFCCMSGGGVIFWGLGGLQALLLVSAARYPRSLGRGVVGGW